MLAQFIPLETCESQTQDYCIILGYRQRNSISEHFSLYKSGIDSNLQWNVWVVRNPQAMKGMVHFYVHRLSPAVTISFKYNFGKQSHQTQNYSKIYYYPWE